MVFSMNSFRQIQDKTLTLILKQGILSLRNKYQHYFISYLHLDDYSLLAVQGPKAIEALQPLTDIDLSS